MSSTSDGATDDLKPPLRTVTDVVRGRPDAEMNTIGWLLLAGMAVLFLPLAPFVLAVWLLSKLPRRRR